MWTIEHVLEATGGRLLHGVPRGEVQGIAIDSRTLEPGQAFVAIRGLRFDGHAFVEAAAAAGATCLIVDQPIARPFGTAAPAVLLVEDTTEALGDLARFHRRRQRATVVAVTGSCGKTTTKELIAQALGGEASEQVLRSAGTQNNHIGVPLALLRLGSRHRWAVVELGTNHPGEIATLASIAQPDLAVITNVGPAHLEFFGSVMEVMREKLSLLESLPRDGCAVLPGDQLDVCLEAPRFLAPGVRTVTFGTSERCDIQAVDLRRADAGMTVRLRDDIGRWRIPLAGVHNTENALAAVAAAWALGVPLSLAKQRLETAVPVPMRSQLMRCNGLTILNDCYNANPLSMARALETLRELPVQRTVAIVGDMLELGDYAPSAHQAIGRLASRLGIDAVLAVGTYAACVADGVREERVNGVRTYPGVAALMRELPELLQPGDGLLVKGSRKLKLETVTAFLVQRYAREAHAHAAP